MCSWHRKTFSNQAMVQQHILFSSTQSSWCFDSDAVSWRFHTMVKQISNRPEQEWRGTTWKAMLKKLRSNSFTPSFMKQETDGSIHPSACLLHKTQRKIYVTGTASLVPAGCSAPCTARHTMGQGKYSHAAELSRNQTRKAKEAKHGASSFKPYFLFISR